MGVLFSCPADDYDPLALEDTPPAGTSGGAGEPAILKALGSGKLLIEGSLSFKRAQAALQVETKISIRTGDAAPAPEPAGPLLPREVTRARFADLAESAAESPKHEAAALRLQKVYKSFRTRRQLADCAVIVEQSWWKLLDFALLKRSSVSFFDIEKQETAMSKWSRARTRAAKVGKGLLKDDKAQKLALQHWLEAIDPRHRYGHNLHYYYDCWLQCESKQPFFYWLDIGEGREINLEGKCSRSKLLSQCIKYLGPKEREDYEVVIEDGKFLYKKSGKILDTSCGPRDAKWIFVLSTSKSLYVGQKRKGTFQHSSFLAGGATSAAGRLVVENGTLKAIWPHSGHYRPTEENFQEFKSFLMDNLVDLTDVKMSPAEEDEEFWGSLRRVTSESEKTEDKTAAPEETGPCQMQPEAVGTGSTETEKCEEEAAAARPESSEDDQEAAEEQAPVPRAKILERINSKKEMKSYQLGKQLSFKWTTGAGPRIGCVRDYPSELQLQALEQVNLSPRCGSTAAVAASRFASPLRRSFNQPEAAKGCDASTPREASRSPLQHGALAVAAAADWFKQLQLAS
ncbi:IQ domain-containing protein IQM2 [Dichanthelium oligosanthes]|uniref:IQ domain-containing protein IQM2 n=1 Tax=Dichanthelium oligosanthes TaxID=888268 RepID=A0A1E5VVK7_9POAL|nr:IQ domain-containing protein IQM2 [Dichanthelium oligosanthes]